MPPRRGRPPTRRENPVRRNNDNSQPSSEATAQNDDQNVQRISGRPRGRPRGGRSRGRFPRGVRSRDNSQGPIHISLSSQSETSVQPDNSSRDEVSSNGPTNPQEHRRSRGRPRGRINHPIHSSTPQTATPEISQPEINISRDEVSSNDDVTLLHEAVPPHGIRRPRVRPRESRTSQTSDISQSDVRDEVSSNDDVTLRPRASRRIISQINISQEAIDPDARENELRDDPPNIRDDLHEAAVTTSSDDLREEVVAITNTTDDSRSREHAPLENENDESEDGGDPEAHMIENEQDRWKKFEIGMKLNRNHRTVTNSLSPKIDAMDSTRQQRLSAFLKAAPRIKTSKCYEELDCSLKRVAELLDRNEVENAFRCLRQVAGSHGYIVFQRFDKHKIWDKLCEKYRANEEIIDEFLIDDGKPSPLFLLLINGLRTKLDDILTTPHLVDSNCAKIYFRDVLNKKIKMKFVSNGESETYLKKAWPYRRFKNINERLTRRIANNESGGSLDSNRFDSDSSTSADDHDDFSEGDDVEETSDLSYVTEISDPDDDESEQDDDEENISDENPLDSNNQEVISNNNEESVTNQDIISQGVNQDSVNQDVIDQDVVGQNVVNQDNQDIIPDGDPLDPGHWEEETNNDESVLEPNIASDDDFSDSSGSEHYIFWFMKNGVRKKISPDSTVYTIIHSYLTKKEICTLKTDEIFEKEYVIYFERVEDRTYENDNDFPEHFEFNDQTRLILDVMKNLYNTYNRNVIDNYDPDIFRSSQIIQKLRPFEKKLISRITGYYPKVIVTLLNHYGFLFDGFCRHKYFIRNLFGLRKVPRGLTPNLIDTIRNKKLLPKIKKKENVQKENLANWTREKFHRYADAKTTFGITFAGEMGIGAGVTRDFFTQMSHYFQIVGSNMWTDLETSPSLDDYVTNEYGLYPTLFDEKYAISDEGTRVLKDFYILGMLTAKSLADKQIMEVPLNKMFLKRLVFGELPSIELSNYDFTKADDQSRKDMKVKKLLGLINQINPTITKIANHLQDIQNNFSDCLESFYIPAGRSWHQNNLVSIDLPEAGTQNIFHLYLNKIKEVVFETGIHEQISKFREGFNHVFPLDHLKNFYTVEEIHKVVFHNKKEDWSADVIRRAFFVNNESFRVEVDKISQILSKFNIDEQRKMLRFFTGSTRLPIGGWTKLKPELAVIEDLGAYPIGRTCFNKLSIPRNNSLQELEEKLKLVINNSEIAERIDRE
ncbi:E3 ubiquitin-protein ligase UPL4 isoform X1 [Rhizophagus clarus]|uniref:E3 ubiquitin-protein ligase UPL4 isoform X1 n=1 Tax=Rhizophagus clarus TaxID=94130 RepID=A0A8H3LGH6_9GLOM|nr:E3 ubiquitin-protein ligase UPL4 isoform X1 [Rhizophagus clarus]